MLDSQSVLYLAIGSVIVGIISACLPSGIGKLIALLVSFPIILFLIISATLGTQITNISDSITFINWFIENFIHIIIGYAFEGAGVGIVKGFRRGN